MLLRTFTNNYRMYEAMHLARCLATRKAPVRRESPALHDTVVETCIDPNKLSELTSEHNLEASLVSKCPFLVRVFLTF
jgi:hypothetical protein